MPLLESSLQASFDGLRDTYLAWIEFLDQDRRYESDDFAKFYEAGSRYGFMTLC